MIIKLDSNKHYTGIFANIGSILCNEGETLVEVDTLPIETDMLRLTSYKYGTHLVPYTTSEPVVDDVATASAIQEILASNPDADTSSIVVYKTDESGKTLYADVTKNTSVTELYFDEDYYNTVQVEKELIYFRKTKIEEVAAACTATIVAGIDVTLSSGVRHYSLTEYDQSNISDLWIPLQLGVTSLPYHSDSNQCELLTAVDAITLVVAALTYKTTCLTQLNHYNMWIRRETDLATLKSITFGTSVLPEDLATNMATVLTGAKAAMDAKVADLIAKYTTPA